MLLFLRVLSPETMFFRSPCSEHAACSVANRCKMSCICFPSLLALEVRCRVDLFSTYSQTAIVTAWINNRVLEQNGGWTRDAGCKFLRPHPITWCRLFARIVRNVGKRRRSTCECGLTTGGQSSTQHLLASVKSRVLQHWRANLWHCQQASQVSSWTLAQDAAQQYLRIVLIWSLRSKRQLRAFQQMPSWVGPNAGSIGQALTRRCFCRPTVLRSVLLSRRYRTNPTRNSKF